MQWLKSCLVALQTFDSERIARLASEACIDEVRQRCVSRLATLNRSEVRGYLAARASGPLRREISRLWPTNFSASEEKLDALIGYATTLVVGRLLREELLRANERSATVSRAA